MSAQMDTEAGVDCPQFHTETIVKEELILEDELPTLELTSHENEEITIKNEPLEEADGEPVEQFFVTEESSLSCDKCSKKFTKQRSYTEHMLRHRNIDSKRFMCESCRKVFGNWSELDRHQQLHGGGIVKPELQYKCEFHSCDKVCDSKKSFEEHLKAHRNEQKKGEKRHRCEKCDKNFANRISLKRHLKLKTCDSTPIVLEEEDGTFKCSTCSNTFSQQHLIDQHIRTHLGTHTTRARATFQCETCGLYVANKKELLQHAAAKHGKVKSEPAELDESDEQGLFVCTECTKTFTQRVAMLRHLRRHEVLNNGSFQCKVCGKCFARKVELVKHSIEKHDEEIMVPKPERPEMDASGRFKCTRCVKTFELRQSCAAHIRKHKIKDSGRYQCKKCLKCFVRPEDLERHERVATTQTASLCTKHLKSLQLNKTNLAKKTDKARDKEHHAIEENGLFICSSCGKTFLKRRCCLAHIRKHVHMEQERFKCKTCGMNFGTNKEIRRHVALKHGQEHGTSAGVEKARK